MTWPYCATAPWAPSSTDPMRPRRWGRSCGSSPSVTSANSTPSHPAYWRDWPNARHYSEEIDGTVMVDLDDTIIEVHGYAKQGSGYGYSGVRGLNALIATVRTGHGAPVITGQRLRKGQRLLRLPTRGGP